MKNSILILLVCMMAACTGTSRKQTLEGEVTPDSPFKAEGLNQAKKIPLSAEIKREEGVKYKTIDKTSAGNGPVVIDFTAELPQREIDLSVYPKAEYVKLRHPLSNQGVTFIGRDLRLVYPNFNGIETDFSSRAYLSGNRIVAGDNYTGIHLFDQVGKYLYTLAAPSYYPDFTQKILTLKIDTTNRIADFSIQGSYGLISKASGWNERMKFSYSLHNLNEQTERGDFTEVPPGAVIMDSASCAIISYNVYRPQNSSFASFFNIESGNTLSVVPNGNPDRTGPLYSYSPDLGFRQYFDGKLQLRQAYNDTLFTVESPQRLIPSYLLRLGDKKIDVIKDLQADKKGKFIPTLWIETDKFVYIAYTEGEDNPSNRKNELVGFHHLYYDKNKGELCRMAGNLSPDKFYLRSTSGDIIPLLARSLQYANGRVYGTYTKASLKKMIDSEMFTTLPQTQKDKANSLFNNLAEGELLLMILQ